MGESSELATRISTKDFFHSLGWKIKGLGFCHAISAPDFECSISAVPDAGRYASDVWFVGVNYQSARSLSHFGFDLPSSFESQEEGYAWMAYGLRSLAWPMIDHGPGWFSYGYANPQLIPFIREREEKKRRYDARPQCWVDRDWMRVARRKMLDYVQQHEALEGNVTVSFDGSLLHFKHLDWHLKVPAEGEAWDHKCEVASNVLKAMPKRFSNEHVVIDDWEGKLGIDRHRYTLIS